MRRVLLSMLFLPHVASATPMDDRLNSAVSRCRDALAEEEPPATEVRDTENGYLRAYGGSAPCGCECDATATAFKAADGTFRTLGYYTAECGTESALTGEDWERVLPDNFRDQLAPELRGYTGPAVFYVKPTLPQHGTDLVLTLELLPIGLQMSCPYGICFESSERSATDLYDRGSFWRVSEEKQKARDESRWRAYTKTRWGRVVLEWDRTTATFRMSEAKRPPELTREAFIEACGIWAPVC